ncbi:MAG: ATP-binding cassette domain-containing protein [Catenulispora sp.]
MSAVLVENLTMRYRGHTALDGVGLEFQENSIHGLLGRNGAGKTTLMRILTGQEFATSGRVELFGQPPRENSAVLSRVCFIRESLKYPTNFKVGAAFLTAIVITALTLTHTAEHVGHFFVSQPSLANLALYPLAVVAVFGGAWAVLMMRARV